MTMTQMPLTSKALARYIPPGSLAHLRILSAWAQRAQGLPVFSAARFGLVSGVGVLSTGWFALVVVSITGVPGAPGVAGGRMRAPSIVPRIWRALVG